MSAIGPPDIWVLAADDLHAWPEQVAALPRGTTLIVPSGDDRYYVIAEIARPLGREAMPILTWAEAHGWGGPLWQARLAGKVFDYAQSADGPSYRERWPGRYPPVVTAAKVEAAA